MKLKCRKSVLSAVSLVFALSMILCETVSTHAKVWSIEDRQQKLMQDINEGQKKKQLTAKEAKKLRESLSDVARKKKKFKDVNGEKKVFDASQKAALEADLNKISTDISKQELEKTVHK